CYVDGYGDFQPLDYWEHKILHPRVAVVEGDDDRSGREHPTVTCKLGCLVYSKRGKMLFQPFHLTLEAVRPDYSPSFNPAYCHLMIHQHGGSRASLKTPYKMAGC